jgi:hypothetical protein
MTLEIQFEPGSSICTDGESRRTDTTLAHAKDQSQGLLERRELAVAKKREIGMIGMMLYVWNVRVADCACAQPVLSATANHEYAFPAAPVWNVHEATPEAFEVVVQIVAPLTVNLTVTP